MELILSIVAIVISLIAIMNERISLHDQAYEKFSQLWLDMDQLFVDHPEMHKFFYKDQDGHYATITPEMKEYEQALCIAERFIDVFQYTSPLEKYLKNSDRESYLQYKEMINNSPILNISRKKLSWSELWKDDNTHEYDC